MNLGWPENYVLTIDNQGPSNFNTAYIIIKINYSHNEIGYNVLMLLEIQNFKLPSLGPTHMVHRTLQDAWYRLCHILADPVHASLLLANV